MFDTPKDLLNHNKRISLIVENKEAEAEETRLRCQSYANYFLCRATASMLLEHGIDHDEFMEAMCDELESRGTADDD